MYDIDVQMWKSRHEGKVAAWSRGAGHESGFAAIWLESLSSNLT